MDPDQITEELEKIFSCCPEVEGKLRASDFIQASASNLNQNTDELSALLRGRLDPDGTDPYRTKEELQMIFLDWMASITGLSPIQESRFIEDLDRAHCSTPVLRGPSLLASSRYHHINRGSSSPSPDVSRDRKSDSSPSLRLMACHEKRRLEQQLEQTELMAASMEERMTAVTTECEQLRQENKRLNHKVCKYVELEGLLEEAAEQQRKLETEMSQLKESLRTETNTCNSLRRRSEDLEAQLAEREREVARWMERCRQGELAAARVTELGVQADRLEAEVQHWRDNYSALRRQSDLAFTEYTNQINMLKQEREQRLEFTLEDRINENVIYEMRSPSIMEEIAAVQHSSNLSTAFDLGWKPTEDSSTQTADFISQTADTSTQTDNVAGKVVVKPTSTKKSEASGAGLPGLLCLLVRALFVVLLFLLMLSLILLFSSLLLCREGEPCLIKVRYSSPPPV